MVSVLLIWMYIFFVTQIIGLGFYKCINRISEREISFDISRNTVAVLLLPRFTRSSSVSSIK